MPTWRKDEWASVRSVYEIERVFGLETAKRSFRRLEGAKKEPTIFV